MARTSSTIGSCHVMLGLQEFFRGTNNRGLIASRPAYVFNVTADGRVRNVGAVPGEEVVHSVYRRNRNVQGVDHGIGRQRPRRDEGLGEHGGVLVECEKRHVLQSGDTACCRFRITGLCLLDDRRGNKQVETCSPSLPPLLRNLLVCRGDEVTTWPCGEIADDSRFEVSFWFHGWTLSNLGLGVKIVPHVGWPNFQLYGVGRVAPSRRALCSFRNRVHLGSIFDGSGRVIPRWRGIFWGLPHTTA